YRLESSRTVPNQHVCDDV
ncbi:glycosyl hydrolases 18 family protein, partial [Vibrio parahaemolyticus EKP-008]